MLFWLILYSPGVTCKSKTLPPFWRCLFVFNITIGSLRPSSFCSRITMHLWFSPAVRSTALLSFHLTSPFLVFSEEILSYLLQPPSQSGSPSKPGLHLFLSIGRALHWLLIPPSEPGLFPIACEPPHSAALVFFPRPACLTPRPF